MKKLLYICVCVGMMGCSNPSVPEVYTDVDGLPTIYPDYTNVTVRRGGVAFCRG